MATGRQQRQTFQCPPVFLNSDDGFTVMISDVGILLLDCDGDVLYELPSDSMFEHKFHLDHIKSRVGRA